MSGHFQEHGLGSSDHATATLAELNAKISNATLDDSSASRTPSAHALDGSEHTGVSGTENNFMALDANGKPKDSTKAASDFQAVSEKGSANGYASLDSGGKVPTSELPDSIIGGLNYQGTWNADTDDPDLSGASHVKGHFYKVSVAGSTNLDGITDWKVGDYAVDNGTAWEKVDNTESVSSVHGRTGAISATASDYDASQIDNDSEVSGDFVDDALNTLNSASHARSHTMTSTDDHTSGNWKLFHSNGSGQVQELALGGAKAPLLGGGAAAAPAFGAMLIEDSVNAAGATPVASDLSAWGNESIGVAKGTGGKRFLCWKDSTGSFAVEMGSI